MGRDKKEKEKNNKKIMKVIFLDVGFSGAANCKMQGNKVQ